MRSGGRDREDFVLAAWKLPLIVAAIAVAIVGGFYLGGPGLGMAVGGLSAATIVVTAALQVPRGPIVPAPLGDFRRHVLLVAMRPVEDTQTSTRVAQLCRGPEDEQVPSEIRVLVPIRGRTLDRWSGDRRVTHTRAQRDCVISLASLSRAGLAAKACVGDADVVLAVEDELRVFPATDVILLTDDAPQDAEERIAGELRSRLRTDFLHLLAAGGATAESGQRARQIRS